MLGAIFLYSLLSWGFVNGVILLRYLLDPRAAVRISPSWPVLPLHAN